MEVTKIIPAHETLALHEAALAAIALGRYAKLKRATLAEVISLLPAYIKLTEAMKRPNPMRPAEQQWVMAVRNLTRPGSIAKYAGVLEYRDGCFIWPTN